MKPKDAKKLLKPYRIRGGKRFRLKDIDPEDTGGFKFEGKKEVREWLQQGAEKLSRLQEKLYAQDRWALLVIIQGIDAAGKDGTRAARSILLRPRQAKSWIMIISGAR